MSRVYTDETREAIRATIAKLVTDGWKNTEIAKHLTEKGFKRPNGKPIDGLFVAGQKKAIHVPVGKQAVKGAAHAPTAETTEARGTTTNTALAILTDDTLTAEKKVELLRSYYAK